IKKGPHSIHPCLRQDKMGPETYIETQRAKDDYYGSMDNVYIYSSSLENSAEKMQPKVPKPDKKPKNYAGQSKLQAKTTARSQESKTSFNEINASIKLMDLPNRSIHDHACSIPHLMFSLK
ncbi:unnamed protein product, partial [Dovyalis caffra]